MAGNTQTPSKQYLAVVYTQYSASHFKAISRTHKITSIMKQWGYCERFIYAFS